MMPYLWKPNLNFEPYHVIYIHCWPRYRKKIYNEDLRIWKIGKKKQKMAYETLGFNKYFRSNELNFTGVTKVIQICFFCYYFKPSKL